MTASTKTDTPSAAIPLLPVKSTSVTAVGYDATTQTLALRFQNGVVYHYPGVPAEVHAGIASAESVGCYLQSSVLGKYRASKQPQHGH